MVPIYDSDIASSRWSRGQWEHYELWEKIEGRLRRKKMLWIGSVLILFVLTFSIGIIQERRVKWGTYTTARILAEQINSIKKEAALNRQAYRIQLLHEGLSYQILKGDSCADPKMVPVRAGRLGQMNGDYIFLDPKIGENISIPGLVDEFCYDSLRGSLPHESVIGIGIVSAKDLAGQRLDRVSLLVLSGSSGEIAFE